MTRFWKTGSERSAIDDGGATSVEYTIVVGFIAVVIISAVSMIGPKVTAMFVSAILP